MSKMTQVSFGAGELSPRMFGRTDLGKYGHGLATCQNFITRKQGVAQRRPGTKYVAACKGQDIVGAGTSDHTVRLIRFKYADDEEYVLEFGGKNGTQLNIVSATSGLAGFGEFVVATDVTSTYPWMRRFTVAGNNDNNNGVYTVRHSVYSAPNTTIRVNEAVTTTTGQVGTITPRIGYIRFYSGDAQLVDPDDGVTPTEINSIWDETHIWDIKYCQSASYMFLAHKYFRPQTLVRNFYDSDHDPAYEEGDPEAWTLSEMEYFDGPYLDVNTTSTTLAYDSGTNIVTASTSGTFTKRDIDRLIRIYDVDQNIWAGFKITSQTDTTHAVVTQEYTSYGADSWPDGITATTNWRMGAWSDEAMGWPRSCQFHQERLWFAATEHNPQTVWSSWADDYTSFRPSSYKSIDELGIYAGMVQDHHAITRTFSDEEVNEIRWIKSDAHGLLCMTNSGIFLLSGVDDAILTPSNNQFFRQNRRGAASQATPASLGNAVLYVTSDTKAVREAAYRSDMDQYLTPDMTLLADHIALAGIVDTATYTYPDDILWCVDNDGSLLGLTYEREEDVVGWHKHIIGGSYGSGQAMVESITSIRASNYDELWMVVKRTVNTKTVRYIEYLKPYHEIGNDHEDAYYVDCGITYDGTAKTTITGLNHLEGQTVDVLGDGLTQASKTVSSGQITIATAASVVQAGLEYTSKGITLPLYPQLNMDSRGNLTRVARAHVSLHLSQGGTVGVDSTLDDISYPDTDLYSGIRTITVPGSSERECQVTFQQTEPQPMTIRSITFEMDSN